MRRRRLLLLLSWELSFLAGPDWVLACSMVPSTLLRQSFSFLIVFSTSSSSSLPLFKDEDLGECIFRLQYRNPNSATALAVVGVVIISFDSPVVVAAATAAAPASVVVSASSPVVYSTGEDGLQPSVLSSLLPSIQ